MTDYRANYGMPPIFSRQTPILPEPCSKHLHSPRECLHRHIYSTVPTYIA